MDMLLNVNTGNIRKLAAFLETVPPEDFDLGDWQTRAPIDAIRLGPIVFRRGCGFAGCAMGWAAYSGIFPGFRINRNGDPCYRGATRFDAVEMLLGINQHNSEFFFYHDSYRGYERVDPADVAKRLRRFVEKVESRIARRSGAAWVKKVTELAV